MSLESTPPVADHSVRRGKRFIVNLLWIWLSVGATLATGLILAPYIIRKLTPEGYGIWLLAFAVVENYVFLDFGFRSATVKYVAHYWALQEPARVNEILNTMVAYSGVVAAALFALVIFASAFLNRFFQVSPAYAKSFRILVILVSLNWCLGFVFNNFAASLEAVQRFDVSSRTGTAVTALKAIGTWALLFGGYGLVQIGALTVACQALGYAIYFYSFRRIFPELRLSTRFASLRTLRKMGSFGIHTFVINISNLALLQAAPVVIGHFLPTAFVGYYGAPNRVLQYSGDAVGRAGSVTNANVAELHARGDTRLLPEIAVYTNRYCLTLFMPLAIFLWLFGDCVFHLWVPSIAQFSAPVLPILLLGYVIGVVGQFSSGMLLQGMGRHQRFARGMAVEAVVIVLALVWAIPRFGIMGAAYVSCAGMILNRGLFVPWLVSRETGMGFHTLLIAIYGRPFLTAIPSLAVAYLLRTTILPGVSWPQLITAAALTAVAYYPIALFSCLPQNHRLLLQGWVSRRLPGLRPA